MSDLWLVESGPLHKVVGVFDDLALAKQAVEELHRNGVWRDRELEWNDATYRNQIYAHPVFPDDWDEERTATIYRVQINKSYTQGSFGELVEGDNV